MRRADTASGSLPDERPRLRGVSHTWAFVASIPAGLALLVAADSAEARLGAAIFGGAVAAMFGVSALYHRVNWTPHRRRWMRRLDHAAIYGLIAGTYAPFGLVALDGAWQVGVLATVWGGSLAAFALNLAWREGPKWTAAATAVGLGWVAIVAAPELARNAGLAPLLLAVAGGLLYSAGALVYVLRRPNPVPSHFAYHEVFHALVTAAVALQYAAVALVVS
jgi:hemolysin III